MAKIRIILKDKHTLILDSDAKAGDVIDLNDLSSLDLSHIDSLILNKAKDELRSDLKREYDLNSQIIKKENEKTIENLKHEYENEISKLTQEINNFKVLREKDIIDTKSKLDHAHLKELNQLNIQINNLKNELLVERENKLLQIENEKSKIHNEYRESINNLNIEIEKIKATHADSLSEIKIYHNNQIQELERDYNLKQNQLKEEISKLTLSKSTLNVKMLGEELENWCNEEYQNYALSGFNFCTWEKDNHSVKDNDDEKGTKADYIFKVYLDADYSTCLTSVCLEMKNESLTSVNKKKNSDHYAKLDKDRIRKDCEYALLISELEWDSNNDSPIKKVPGYEKMYVVRPQYFITFLSIINNLASKYRDIITQKISESIKFKTSMEILDEFEKMKTTYFDKPLAQLTKQVEEILTSAEAINKQSSKIQSVASTILNTTISNILAKIDRFDIKKLTRKIDKLDE